MDTRSSGATQALGEDAFRRVVEWAPTAMVLIDGAGRIALINAQAERLFGYSREDLQGQTVECLIPERYTATHGGFREGFFANPHPRPMGSGRDLYARHQDSSEFPVEIGLNPIDTPEGTMVLASIVDMSERRRAQQRIENALAEKTVLLNEVHHRVKNNLQLVSSLLNLQALHATDPQLRAILGESQSRVRAMALTHQLLYERKDYSRIDLGDYLNRLVQLLIGSYRETGKQIAVHKILPEHPQYLDFERTIPCGLMVNELVTNAYKHAFAGMQGGEIRIELQTRGDEIELSVADNGVGLPAGFDMANVTSLGLQLVPLLADQIGGQLAIEGHPGCCVTLRFASDPSRRI
ncbi:PAS domain S-box protein [Azoarcus communis]|uniref:sensor histidine kinase n=1 Tax=Parazoarcus communis TaxID=41977 RepID=UPI001459A54F|nr:histidine kinase dimerization/phosphoacceptor domain -containing protein [Parazoarcus communis]NMG48614.1 PAS domain S-box protein [Parazoarcus communis]